ncbi:MAG TPA: nucleotide sugar dehydrogenase, partial [Planctomycetota bacterium]|nr:nucleotide sugar dehydrogenase [Planctomycetota bacterium]
MSLESLIRAHKAVVGVIGLGYVGLPLVRLFASKGFRVLGFDIDQAKIERLQRGESYIRSVPSQTLRKLRRRFEATSDFSRLREADAIIICVPTPLLEDGRPDLSFIRITARTIGQNLRKGQLVVLESTTYPGTTREIMKPELDKTGLDYLLAFSPEREDPGNRQYTNADIPKVVGGIDERSRKTAAALYGSAVVRVVEVSSCEVAEAAKLLENIYRCVNIALVNELKMCLERMG